MLQFFQKWSCVGLCEKSACLEMIVRILMLKHQLILRVPSFEPRLCFFHDASICGGHDLNTPTPDLSMCSIVFNETHHHPCDRRILYDRLRMHTYETRDDEYSDHEIFHCVITETRTQKYILPLIAKFPQAKFSDRGVNGKSEFLFVYSLSLSFFVLLHALRGADIR